MCPRFSGVELLDDRLSSDRGGCAQALPARVSSKVQVAAGGSRHRPTDDPHLAPSLADRYRAPAWCDQQRQRPNSSLLVRIAELETDLASHRRSAELLARVVAQK